MTRFRLLRASRFHYVAPPKPPGAFRLGVNLSGAENQYPNFPDATEMAWWVARGITTFRLPILWNATQLDGTVTGCQTAAGSALNAAYMAQVSAALAAAKALGATLLIDVHGSGRGFGATVGSAAVPVSAFVDLWTKLSAYFLADPSRAAIRGYDLMNEWHDMDPNAPAGVNSTPYSQALIQGCNQGAISAIRANGDATPIYVEGDHYSGAWDWVANNGVWALALADPADELVFSVHCYLDSDSSGTNFAWGVETTKPGYAPPGLPVSAAIGPQRMAGVVAWATANRKRLHLGEVGWGTDEPCAANPYGADDWQDWNAAGAAMLAFCRDNNVEVDVWGNGPGFQPTTYGYCAEPAQLVAVNGGIGQGAKDFSAAGVQGTQMVVLEQFAGYAGAQPSAYKIEMPLVSKGGVAAPVLFGPVGQAMGAPGSDPQATYFPFRVKYAGILAAPVTITPRATLADGTTAAEGTFSPATVVLQPGLNPSATFTFTPGRAAALKLTATNDTGWSDPVPIAFSSLPDLIRPLAVMPANIFALRLLNTGYAGPAIRLQRPSDAAQRDFFFDNNGNLPRQAIQDWAGARTIPVATWYDQSPAGNSIAFSAKPNLVLVDATGYPSINFPSACLGLANTPDVGATRMSVFARMAGTAGDLATQDLYGGTFRLTNNAFSIGPNGGESTLGTNAPSGAWSNVGATYSSAYAGNNFKTYLAGSIANQASIGQFALAPAYGQFRVGNFQFGDQHYVGSVTDLLISYDEWSPAQVAAFAQSAASYYATALPDSLSAVAPTITGAAAQTLYGSGSFGPTTPFSGVTIADGNGGGATDGATITLSGGTGTLTGAGLAGSGPYTLAADTAANLTSRLRALQFTSSAPSGTAVTLALAVASSAGTAATSSATVMTLQTAPAETPLVPVAVPAALPLHYKGVNLAGGENDYTYAGQKLQQWPSPAALDHWNALGLKTIRLPFHTADIQPAANGPLDASIVATIRGLVERARGNGQFVVLDPHDYGSNQLGVIGVAAGSTAAFVDFWKRVATVFQNYPNVIYGLMNEPNFNCPGLTPALWRDAAAAAVAGIRMVSTTQMVFIPGAGSYTGAHSWVADGNAAAWAGYTDPAGGPFMFEMHEYLDASYSGTQKTCVNGYAAMAGAVSWARQNGFKIFVGEFAYTTDATCAAMGPAFVQGMSGDGDVILGWTWWGAGPEFGSSYLFNLNPNSDGSDQPQVATLTANLANTVTVAGTTH